MVIKQVSTFYEYFETFITENCSGAPYVFVKWSEVIIYVSDGRPGFQETESNNDDNIKNEWRKKEEER